MRRWRLVTAVIVAGLVAAACGGDSSDATSTTAAAEENGSTVTTAAGGGDATADIDPCTLLTAADLETATGVAFAEGTYNESLSQDELWICDWAASGSEFATAQVLIIPIPGAFAGNRESASDALGEVDDVDIPGADDAYVTTEGSILGMLVGDLFVQVAYIGVGPDDVLAATTELATVVVGNL
jgi:hypothetical protein